MYIDEEFITILEKAKDMAEQYGYDIIQLNLHNCSRKKLTFILIKQMRIPVINDEKVGLVNTICGIQIDEIPDDEPEGLLITETDWFEM